MKKTLLFSFILCLFAFAASAQQNDCDGCAMGNDYETKPAVVKITKPAKKKKVSVYPNPAVNFIGLSDSKDVKKIIVLNVMGRETKTFNTIEKGRKYDVADLKRGMYLVQIFDNNNKIITTQRLNKR